MNLLKLLNPFTLLSSMGESCELARVQSLGRIPQIPDIHLPEDIFDKDEYLDYYEDDKWEVRSMFDEIAKIRKKLRDNPNLIIPYSGRKTVGEVVINGRWHRIHSGYAIQSYFAHEIAWAQRTLDRDSSLLTHQEYKVFKKAAYYIGGFKITTVMDHELRSSLRIKRL